MTPPPPPPPVIVQKKRGLGCFGCGCLALVALVLLGGAIAAAFGYLAYTKGAALTAAAPSTLQTFDGGDVLYQGTLKKLNTFGQAVSQGQPASLELSADELNTLIARNPDLAANQVHLFVTMTGDQAQLQMSVPTNLLPMGLGDLVKDRFVNGSLDFSPTFDPATKTLNLNLRGLRLGPEDVPKDSLPTMEQELTPVLNSQLQSSPNIKPFLDHARTVEIRNGLLELETQ